MNEPLEMLLFCYAESPVHAGASNSRDVIDLPIQREAATTYPVIWGQSLKGALRQAATRRWNDDARVDRVFGRAVDAQLSTDPEAGALTVGDAQLVAMPVPTMQRTFVWTTSAIALRRLARKYRGVSLDHPPVPNPSADSSVAADRACDQSRVLGPIIVDDITVDPGLAAWGRRLAQDVLGPEDTVFEDRLKTNLLLLDDTTFPGLLRECTDLVARVQLDGEKKVKHGPFYSEYLPTETILAASLTLYRTTSDKDGSTQRADADKLRGLLDNQLHQIGGDETLGKGLVWTRLHERVAS